MDGQFHSTAADTRAENFTYKELAEKYM